MVEVPAGVGPWVQSSELKMDWGGGVGGVVCASSSVSPCGYLREYTH